MKKFVLSLFFLVTLGLASGCNSSWPPLAKSQIQISSSCTSVTKNATCSIRLVSDPRSPNTFNWKATVQPNNIHLGISSGTITAGGSNEIQFQVLHEECPVNVTFTGSDGTVIKTGNMKC